MIKLLLTCLCLSSLLIGILACRHREGVQPVARSTDQIAQVTEQLGEFMFNTQYKYDQEGRLIGQTVDGIIRPHEGESTPTTSTFDYTFGYEPAALIMTSTKTTKTGSQTYNAQSIQRIPLNNQKFVSYSPRFFCMDCVRGYGFGVSALLLNAISPLGTQADTLRRYTASGYLNQVEYIRYTPRYSSGSGYTEVQRMNLTVSNGNVSQVTLLREDNPYDTHVKPTSLTSLNDYTYNTSRAGLPNPYQFMGTTNTHLIRSETIKNFSPHLPLILIDYQYEYDKKGRVKQYTITSRTPDNSPLWATLVGRVTYTNP